MGEARLVEARREASEEGWGPAFPEGEYAARVHRVVEQMRTRGIDALLVTSPANITYLTGYDMVWYYLRTPSAVVVRADDAATLMYELEYHRPTVEYHAVVDDVCCFESFHGAVEVIIEDLRQRGWDTGTVGFEFWSRNPNGEVLDALRQGVQARCKRVVDGSWLVDTVKLIKSEREVDVMREASRIADMAMREAMRTIRVGMTEIELAGVVLGEMMKHGGGDPAIRVAVRSGPRFLARHCAPSHRRFQPGELIWVNFCGSFHRYHSDLGRLISLGSPDQHWQQLIETADAIASRILGAVQPGDATQRVQTAAEQAIDDAGLTHQAVLVGGYDMGIAIPPDWVGHTFTKAARGVVEASYDPGMATNFEFLFRSGEGWRGGAGGGFIDTVVMGTDGLEILSSLPRQIFISE